MAVEVCAAVHAPEWWLLGGDKGDNVVKDMGGNPLLNTLSNLLLCEAHGVIVVCHHCVGFGFYCTLLEQKAGQSVVYTFQSFSLVHTPQ
jgi:hypothetical protein